MAKTIGPIDSSFRIRGRPRRGRTCAHTRLPARVSQCVTTRIRASARAEGRCFKAGGRALPRDELQTTALQSSNTRRRESEMRRSRRLTSLHERENHAQTICRPLGRRATAGIACAALVGSPAFADTTPTPAPTPSPSSHAPKTLAQLQAAVAKAASARETRVTTAISKVTGDKYLSSGDRSTLLGTLNADLAALKSSASTIAADTSATQAKADLKQARQKYPVVLHRDPAGPSRLGRRPVDRRTAAATDEGADETVRPALGHGQGQVDRRSPV